DNPARWDLLRHTPPARKGARAAGHFRALSYSDMPVLMVALSADPSMAALCMRFTILTVARTKESTACRWSEVDFAARTRGVQILKGGHAWQHLVPLSDQAIELLRGLLVDGKHTAEHVFPAPIRRNHLGNGAMMHLIGRLEWSDRTTVHGIRAAFKT